ncbi:MAG: acyltransferase family protein [Alphaproteobacteria bacterium]|nr:acyltransferase family protein [Alphaproteobacteria bacterium]
MRATQPLFSREAGPAAGRIAWVDYAKGVCILLVVMFHTVNHYEEAVGATGWMRWIVDFSKPFRMPDFFLISGLFLSRTINAPLRDYIDRKVLHFAYFYFLWLAITLAVTDLDVLRADPAEWAKLFGWHMIQPVGTLWFVHMLAIFYVLTRLVRKAPKLVVLAAAAGLQIAHQAQWIDTPSFAVNRLMDYYVYFFLGYALSEAIFAMADRVRETPRLTIAMLAVWAMVNFQLTSNEVHGLPVLGLVMGLVGAFAVVQLSVLLSRARAAGFLGYCGRNSIVIYLAFFFPMMALERLLAGSNAIPDVGWACATILVVSLLAPLAMHQAIRGTPLRALFERPRMVRLGGRKAGAVEAAA